MTPEEIIQIIQNTTEETGEELESAADAAMDLAEEGQISAELIEAIFRLYERFNDPSQTFFNVLESAQDNEETEELLCQQARASIQRAPNYTNTQFLGTSPEDIALLKALAQGDYDAKVPDWVTASEIREHAQDVLSESDED